MRDLFVFAVNGIWLVVEAFMRICRNIFTVEGQGLVLIVAFETNNTIKPSPLWRRTNYLSATYIVNIFIQCFSYMIKKYVRIKLACLTSIFRGTSKWSEKRKYHGVAEYRFVLHGSRRKSQPWFFPTWEFRSLLYREFRNNTAPLVFRLSNSYIGFPLLKCAINLKTSSQRYISNNVYTH